MAGAVLGCVMEKIDMALISWNLPSKEVMAVPKYRGPWKHRAGTSTPGLGGGGEAS
jgi:hypothetical protein